MPYMPRGVAESQELIKHLEALAPLPPEVVNFRYTLEDDWSGDPAIFFGITLSDEAADPAILHQTARRITNFVTQQVDPAGQWGLFPYFNYRSQSEQAELKGKLFG